VVQLGDSRRSSPWCSGRTSSWPQSRRAPQVFVVENGTHELYSQHQNTPGGDWSPNWDRFGAPFVDGEVRLASSPGVVADSDGRLEVFVVGNDGFLWNKFQTEPSNGWSPNWNTFGAPTDTRLSDTPTLGINEAIGPSGRLEIFVVADDGNWWHEWQTGPGNGWSGWSTLPFIGKPLGHSSLVVGSNADGRLEVFGVDGDVIHDWQDPSEGTNWWTGPKDCDFFPCIPIGNPPASLGSPPGVRLIAWDWPLQVV
jgi:hypothetical protein